MNIERKRAGKNIANSLWLWSPGKSLALPSFKQKFGLNATAISAVDLIKGIGICADMHTVDVEGATGTVATNYEGKAEAAIKALQDAYQTGNKDILGALNGIQNKLDEIGFGKIATVSAGYADGVPSGFNSDARVLVNGIRCPLVGKVGLDETIIDITNAGEVNVGDEVVFIGEQSESEISLVDYSKWTSRIPWETMVAIPRRVKRILTYK